VGNNPDSFALVIQAGGVRSNTSPACIVPQRGKIAQHSVESSKSKNWRVFNECVAGSYFAQDAGKFGPEPASLTVESVDSVMHGGLRGQVLAREAARNHVNNSPPWFAVKSSHVIPDGKRFQDSVILSGNKYACGVTIPFNCTDSAPPEDLASEYAATSACEKSQLIHFLKLKRGWATECPQLQGQIVFDREFSG
jgi:hypothetical protein